MKKFYLSLLLLQLSVSKGVLDQARHLRDQKFLRNENSQAPIIAKLPNMISLDNTVGTFAGDRLYSDPKYAQYGKTYISNWEENVDAAGNINRKSQFATKGADGLYLTNNRVETFNGHVSDKGQFNVNNQIKFRREHKKL